MPAKYTEIEKRLWAAADELRANSKLKPSEYSLPVLGLIFLRYAEHKVSTRTIQVIKRQTADNQIKPVGGILNLPPTARYSRLLQLPKGANVGKAIDDAMREIEEVNEDLKDVLPKNYHRIDSDILRALLKNIKMIGMDIEGDAFGKIYEYFLGNFAMSEGQKGGEFYTPTSLVKLIVEIIEPFHGKLFDPACGSGGMFVQSATLVEKRRKTNPKNEISIYGQDKIAETVRLCRLNLAVHGLKGDIRHSNTYYEDVHDSVGKFDFVMANPPFNVDKVDKERLKGDRRFPFGMPRMDNANYIWIQLIYSALNENGRAGFVMANSACDVLGSEQEIRRQIIESGVVDVMIAVGPYFFYTVRLPCSLWFFDRAKSKTPRRDKVLFIDARHIFQKRDRAHREFSEQQIQFLANIVRMYRQQPIDTELMSQPIYLQPNGTVANWQELFPDNTYRDIAGLCKVATIAEIGEQNWSLNPGRYVGFARRPEEDIDLAEKLEELNEQLVKLNSEAQALEERIAENISLLLESLKT